MRIHLDVCSRSSCTCSSQQLLSRLSSKSRISSRFLNKKFISFFAAHHLHSELKPSQCACLDMIPKSSAESMMWSVRPHCGWVACDRGGHVWGINQRCVALLTGRAEEEEFLHVVFMFQGTVFSFLRTGVTGSLLYCVFWSEDSAAGMCVRCKHVPSGNAYPVVVFLPSL